MKTSILVQHVNRRAPASLALTRGGERIELAPTDAHVFTLVAGVPAELLLELVPHDDESVASIGVEISHGELAPEATVVYAYNDGAPVVGALALGERHRLAVEPGVKLKLVLHVERVPGAVAPPARAARRPRRPRGTPPSPLDVA